MGRDRVFTSKKRRVLRKHIPFAENFSGIILLCALSLTVIWFAIQKTNYDPRERDLSYEQLLKKSNELQLYTPPLKPWVEPGTSHENSTQNLGIFPRVILDEEWRIASRLKQFHSANLYEKINGEAEKFIRQGFQTLSYLVLRSGRDQSEIAIELYDQGDLGGSLGIFADHLSEEKVIEQKGPVTYFITSAGAIGRKGRFFFRIAGDQSTENIQAKSLQLLESFSQLPQDAGEIPRAYQMLSEKMEIPLMRISFQKQNVFQYDFVEDFWFARLQGSNRARIFLHQASSREEAGVLFEEILAEQSYDYNVVRDDGMLVVMFHDFLKNYFAIQHQGPYIFGIENIEDLREIDPLMERLSWELEDD